jgi:hypothetical protein
MPHGRKALCGASSLTDTLIPIDSLTGSRPAFVCLLVGSCLELSFNPLRFKRLISPFRRKGLGAAALRVHAKGSSVLFGQHGFSLADPLLDVEGERATPLTEPQMNDTVIVNRATPRDPPLPHKVFDHRSHCRQSQT